MKKDLTELVFILDHSGSMSGLEADTIGGFNGLIEKQRKVDGEALVSCVLFDDRSEVIYDRAVNYQCDSAGTNLNFEVVSEAVCTVRCSAPLSKSWKKRIDEDFKNRN